MSPIILLSMLPLALPTQDTSFYRTEDVSYQNGGIQLGALLMLPKQAGPHPAAVIIHGSGPSDRRNAWAHGIAEEIVRSGYAVLLTDKRGSGGSTGDWQTAGFDELADDALAGVAYLEGRNDINEERIGVVGLSQGGWIAPVAASKSARIAFVVNIVGATVSYAEQSSTRWPTPHERPGLPMRM